MRVCLLPHADKHSIKSLPPTRKCELTYDTPTLSRFPVKGGSTLQLRPWVYPRQRSVTGLIGFPGLDSTFHCNGGQRICASMLSSRMDDTTPVGLEGCSVEKWPQKGSRRPLPVTGADAVDVSLTLHHQQLTVGVCSRLAFFPCYPVTFYSLVYLQTIVAQPQGVTGE